MLKRRSTERPVTYGRGVTPALRPDEPPLERMIAETVSLFHRLKVAAEEMHGQGDNTAGRRGILRGLSRLGPQSVPQMARSRPVSRQHVQSLVNGLLKDGLVALTPNPAHQRSHLVQLTKKGTALVESMIHKERAVLSRLRLSLSERELNAAAKVLCVVREHFSGPGWKRALRGSR